MNARVIVGIVLGTVGVGMVVSGIIRRSAITKVVNKINHYVITGEMRESISLKWLTKKDVLDIILMLEFQVVGATTHGAKTMSERYEEIIKLLKKSEVFK